MKPKINFLILLFFFTISCKTQDQGRHEVNVKQKEMINISKKDDSLLDVTAIYQEIRAIDSKVDTTYANILPQTFQKVPGLKKWDFQDILGSDLYDSLLSDDQLLHKIIIENREDACGGSPTFLHIYKNSIAYKNVTPNEYFFLKDFPVFRNGLRPGLSTEGIIKILGRPYTVTDSIMVFLIRDYPEYQHNDNPNAYYPGIFLILLDNQLKAIKIVYKLTC